MNRFFAPDCKEFELYSLTEEEGKHASRVLRMKEGDALELIDGRGGLFLGHITESSAKRLTVHVGERQFFSSPRPYHLHIAIAPTKSLDRLEWFLEKAVEIGVDEISFLKCQRSERKEVNISRLQKVAISAMKQCLGYWLPVLHEIRPYEAWIGDTRSQQHSAIAHCLGSNKKGLKELVDSQRNSEGSSAGLQERREDSQARREDPQAAAETELELGVHDLPHCVILIGPEGDFSEAEITLANNLGFMEINLGPQRLRTETAALVACVEMSLLFRGKVSHVNNV